MIVTPQNNKRFVLLKSFDIRWIVTDNRGQLYSFSVTGIPYQEPLGCYLWMPFHL